MCDTRERLIKHLNKRDWDLRKRLNELNKEITEHLIELNEIDGKLQRLSTGGFSDNSEGGLDIQKE